MAEIRIRLGDDTNYIDIDKSMIESVSVLKQMTTDASSIQYGVLPSTGSLEVIDKGDFIKNKIESGELPYSNVPVRIYVNEKLYATMYTSDDANYTNEKHFTVSLKDSLSRWDNLTYGGRHLTDSMSAYDLLKEVLMSFGYENEEEILSMLSEKIVYGEENNESLISSYLASITIPYPYLKLASYRETIDEFCSLLQLCCVSNEYGSPMFYSGKPTIRFVENIPIIDTKTMIKEFKKSLFVKNKFDTVDLRATNVEDLIDYSDVVNTFEDKIISYSYSNGVGSLPAYYNGVNGVGAKIETYYSSGEYSFKTNSDDNLNQILKIEKSDSPDSEGFYKILLRNNNLPYSVTYKKISGWFKNETQALSDLKVLGDAPYGKESVFNNNEYAENVSFDSKDGDSFSGKLPTSLPYPYDEDSSTVEISDNSYIKVKIENNIVYVKYYLLSKAIYYRLQTNRYENFRQGSEIYQYVSSSCKISIYGDQREISFKDESLKYSNSDSQNTVITIDTGLLCQTSEQKQNIAQSIFKDYNNGIANGSNDLFLINIYDSSGNKIKDWDNGEMLTLNNIVRFDKTVDSRLWKIVGTKFTYDGEPLLSLELMEMPQVIIYFPETIIITKTINEKAVEITSGELVYLYDQLTIKIADDYTVSGFMGVDYFAFDAYINGRLVKNGDFLVSQFITEEPILNIEVKTYHKQNSIVRLDIPYVKVSGQTSLSKSYTINHDNSNVEINDVFLYSDRYYKIKETYNSGDVFYSGSSIDSGHSFIAIDKTGEFASSDVLNYQIPLEPDIPIIPI